MLRKKTMPKAETHLVDRIVASRPYRAMVRRYVAVLSGDAGAVDDLVQEVLVRTLERQDRISSPDAVARYMRGVARRVVQEHFRARWRLLRHEVLTAEALLVEFDPVAACHDRWLASILVEQIQQLPVVSRRMILMWYEDGCDASEIGAAFEISSVAVRVSLHRIRQRLRKRVQDVMQSGRSF